MFGARKPEAGPPGGDQLSSSPSWRYARPRVVTTRLFRAGAAFQAAAGFFDERVSTDAARNRASSVVRRACASAPRSRCFARVSARPPKARVSSRVAARASFPSLTAARFFPLSHRHVVPQHGLHLPAVARGRTSEERLGGAPGPRRLRVPPVHVRRRSGASPRDDREPPVSRRDPNAASKRSAKKSRPTRRRETDQTDQTPRARAANHEPRTTNARSERRRRCFRRWLVHARRRPGARRARTRAPHAALVQQRRHRATVRKRRPVRGTRTRSLWSLRDGPAHRGVRRDRCLRPRRGPEPIGDRAAAAVREWGVRESPSRVESRAERSRRRRRKRESR